MRECMCALPHSSKCAMVVAIYFRVVGSFVEERERTNAFIAPAPIRDDAACSDVNVELVEIRFS